MKKKRRTLSHQMSKVRPALAEHLGEGGGGGG